MTVWKYEADGGTDGELSLPAYSDAEAAAEAAWEKLCHDDSDYYKGGAIDVWRDGEEKRRFEVEVEMTPQFHARETYQGGHDEPYA